MRRSASIYRPDMILGCTYTVRIISIQRTNHRPGPRRTHKCIRQIKRSPPGPQYSTSHQFRLLSPRAPSWAPAAGTRRIPDWVMRTICAVMYRIQDTGTSLYMVDGRFDFRQRVGKEKSRNTLAMTSKHATSAQCVLFPVPDESLLCTVEDTSSKTHPGGCLKRVFAIYQAYRG